MYKTSDEVNAYRLQVIERIIATGGNCRDVGNVLGLSKSGANKAVAKFGLSTGDKLELAKKASVKPIPKNLFVDPLTPPMAWLLGVIASDGCIKVIKNRWFNTIITSCDLDICMKAQAITGLGRVTPRRKVNGQKQAYDWQQGGSGLSSRLSKYGIVPAKSLILEMPVLDAELMPHFVRGLWDGDGHISSTRKAIAYSSGSLNLVDSLSVFLEGLIGYKPTRSQSRTSNVKALSYHGIKALAVLNWIYDGSTPGTRMDRKYNEFLLFSS